MYQLTDYLLYNIYQFANWLSGNWYTKWPSVNRSDHTADIRSTRYHCINYLNTVSVIYEDIFKSPYKLWLNLRNYLRSFKKKLQWDCLIRCCVCVGRNHFCSGDKKAVFWKVHFAAKIKEMNLLSRLFLCFYSARIGRVLSLALLNRKISNNKVTKVFQTLKSNFV